MHDPIEMGTGEMTDHDPMCPATIADGRWRARCECDLIARVRADERAKVYRPDAHRMMLERDAARAEVERLQRLVAVLEKMLDTEAMVLADLRAKVEGLPVLVTDMHNGTGPHYYEHTVLLADVLALIEEASRG